MAEAGGLSQGSTEGPDPATPIPLPTKPDHLILFVHGLYDTHSAWDNCMRELSKLPHAPQRYLLHSSAVNGRFRTYDGFDRCGQRLAEELRELVGRHPHLAKLSVFGHSMGGLIARYALGVLYDPRSGTVCGLAPRHFVTLASPHMGLTAAEGPAQVPFVAWAGHVPLVGGALQRALQSVAGGVACSLFRGTGRHFLALDGGSGELPLLLRLAMDHEGHQGAAGAQGGVPPEVQAQEGPKCGGNCCGAAGGGGGGGDSSGGQYFFSALRAFRSRACYGNVGRDHWVSWQNSTVRDTCHLPALDPEVVRRGRGVVREDPLQEGFFHAGKQGGQGQGDHGDAQQSGNTQGAGAVPNGAAVGAAGGAEEGRAARATAALMEGLRHAPLLAPGEGGGQGEARSGGVGGGAAPEVVLEAAAMMCPETPQQVVAMVLQRLRLLPWRRVDVSFAGAAFGSAHNNIQATRWTNRVGMSVLAHVREHFQAAEEFAEQLEREQQQQRQL